MMKPFTCVCLLAAAGSLLYLYQEKHAAQLVDRETASLVKQADQIRERTGLLRAEYAMLNDPERLSQLAGQHLALQPLTPGQFVKLTDLGSRLPGPVAAAPEPAAMDDAPIAAAAPPVPNPVVAAVPVPARAAEPVQRTQVAVLAPPPRRPTKPHDEAAAAKPVSPPAIPGYAPDASALYAPVLPAFASQKPTHQPTMQRASAGLADAPATYAAAVPYVGSALGMAHNTLAAPVPMSAAGGATEVGSSYGR